MRPEMNSEEDDIIPVRTTGKNYSTPGNIDVTTARYSPAFTPGQRHDDVPLADAGSRDVVDDVVRRGPYDIQRSSPPRRHYSPTWPHQNGFGGGYHDNAYVVREDPDVRRRPTVGGRSETELQYRSRSSYDDRVDTPASGRLSQSALMVREMFEDDDDFDQEVAVTRGGLTTHQSLHPASFTRHSCPTVYVFVQ